MAKEKIIKVKLTEENEKQLLDILFWLYGFIDGKDDSFDRKGLLNDMAKDLRDIIRKIRDAKYSQYPEEE